MKQCKDWQQRTLASTKTRTVSLSTDEQLHTERAEHVLLCTEALHSLTNVVVLTALRQQHDDIAKRPHST